MRSPGNATTYIDPSSRCFFDTNIIVYALGFDEQEKSRIARPLLTENLRRGTFCTSTQVMLETYNTLTRKIRQKASPMDAQVAVEWLSRFGIHTVDLPTIHRGIALSRQSQISIWDALVVSSASSLRASVLYTEDLNHGQLIEGVRVVNPFLTEVEQPK